jgi:hypothetical protein
MSNLDFAKQEDRYQSKSEAMGEKESEERSQMEELLAQLRALARRQEEVIERMRELESRVRDSVDEKEREAAKRELKKLSDEQKALARELENTQQKAAEKNESLARQSEELDAAREAAQRAASAMEKGALDEARASAARSSEKLRAGGEALRQQLSGRTREAARDLQQRAQELVEQEQSIAEALETQRKGGSRLSQGGLPKELESQRKRLKTLQQEIQRAAEATEVSEPLFSKALQDLHRSSVQNETELKLKVVEEALAARRQDVAQRAEKSAGKDVQELAQSVENAAEEVLGDDAQALRQARAAVDKIARELSEKAGLAMGGRQRAADPDQATAPDRAPAAGSHEGTPGAESNQPGGGDNSKAVKATGTTDKAVADVSAESQKARAARSKDLSQGQTGPGKENVSAENTEGKGSPEGAVNKPAGDGKGAENGSERSAQAGMPIQQAKADSARSSGKGDEEDKGDSSKGGGGGAKAGTGGPSNAGESSVAKGGNSPAQGKEAGAETGANVPSGDGPSGGENWRVKQGASMERGGGNQMGGGYAGGGGGVPVQDLGDWLNRLDRVEALLERPQLRAGVARVQQAVEQLRGDMKRNATKPSPEQIQQNLLAPLTELRDAISSELARREGRENDAPIDRDPVPRKYEASVRRYYEALGGGK